MVRTLLTEICFEKQYADASANIEQISYGATFSIDPIGLPTYTRDYMSFSVFAIYRLKKNTFYDVTSPYLHS